MSEQVTNSYEEKLKRLEERKEELKKNYRKIEDFFKAKNNLFEQFKHIPVDEIINNSPKYYSLIRIVEQINSFLNNDPNWLKKFIAKAGIKFNWEQYEKWKAGVDFYRVSYDDTYSPAKWIHLVQDKLIEILKQYKSCYI